MKENRCQYDRKIFNLIFYFLCNVHMSNFADSIFCNLNTHFSVILSEKCKF